MYIFVIMIKPYWLYYDYNYEYDVAMEKFLFHLLSFCVDNELSIC